jgi:hypothetical protein
VPVFFPDVLSGDQFTEKSEGEHLKPNDAAGRTVDQQRPAASGPKTINSKAPRQPAYHKRDGPGRPEQEGGETDAAQRVRGAPALLRELPLRVLPPPPSRTKPLSFSPKKRDLPLRRAVAGVMALKHDQFNGEGRNSAP